MESLKFCRKYKYKEYEERLSCIRKLPYLKGIGSEEIVVSFTKDIRDLLNKVEKCLNSNSLNKKSSSEVLLLDSHSSATIEGCKTTIDNIKKCIKGTNPSKDDLMVLNIINAQKKYRNYHIANYIDIVNMWKVLSNNVCENVLSQGTLFRKEMVYVGSESRIIHTPEKPEKIESKMNLLVKFINSTQVSILMRGIISHYYIEYIHPMCDCNGRLGRLLQTVIISNKYDNIYKIPIISVINENLSGYYKSLQDSNVVCTINNKKYLDISPFLEYVLICFLIAFERCKFSLSENEKKLVIAMKKRGVGCEITVKNACKVLHSSNESTVRNVLNSLVFYGILSKKKVGNKNIYRLER